MKTCPRVEAQFLARALACLLTTLHAGVASAQGPLVFEDVSDSSHLQWMQTDTKLQVPITMNLNGKPLRVVLAAISQQTGISVRAASGLQEYRVSVHTTAQPLARIMLRLKDLFGHGDLPNKNYGWTHTVENKVPRYALTRNARAYEQEAEMLDIPRTRRIKWLRQIRDFARLPSEKRKTFQSDCPCLQYFVKTGEDMTANNPVAEVVAALTDAQLTTLLNKGRVDVPQLILSDHAMAYLQGAVPQGSGVNKEFDDYNPPANAQLALSDDGKHHADWRGISSLNLYFGSGFPRYCPIGLAFDTLGQLPDGDPSPASDTHNGTPQIDLLAHEKPEVDRRPQCTLSAALRLLAQEAHINVYVEIFPKSPKTLLRTTGTVEDLLNFICHTYGCDWRKVGGDYLVYSKAWAQDRAADIPQPILNRWIANYTQHHRYELQDLMEMACCTEEQYATIINLFKVQGPLAAGNQNALRLLGTISPHDLTRAYTPQGVLIDSLDEAHQRVAQELFHGKEVVLPITVHLRYESRAEYGKVYSRTVIEFTDLSGATAERIAADDARIFQPAAPVK